jgi:hypothetical protein
VRIPEARCGATSRFLDVPQDCRRVSIDRITACCRTRGACRRTTVEETELNAPDANASNEPVPWMQQLLDNPFLLLFIGVLVPMLVYTLWGVIDILTIPMAK